MEPIRFINPYNTLAKASEYVMEGIHSMGATDILPFVLYPKKMENTTTDRYEPTGSVAQATYLLPRGVQRREFLRHGYILGKKDDYGLVKKAVSGRNLPIYQTAPDQIDRNDLLFISNRPNIISENGLFHAGSYPSALYTDFNGNLYAKSWDLNDYGDDPNGNSGNTDSGFMKAAANFLDRIGSPVVVTTGYQRALGINYRNRRSKPRSKERFEKLTLTHPDVYKSDVEDFLKTKGLTLRPLNEITGSTNPDQQDGKYAADYYLSLPEVTIKPRKK